MLGSVRCFGVIVFRRPSHFRRVIPFVTQKQFYAYDHDHGHKVHKEIVHEPPENSKEYFAKYYGHLLDEKNKPEDIWAITLLTSPAVLECIAEINGSEFKIDKITAANLITKYKEQLVYFENIRKPALEAAGISGRIIHYLHEIYKLRAFVPVWEVEQAVSEIGFLGKNKKNYRVTAGVDGEKYPHWRLLKFGQILSTTFFNPSYDPETSLYKNDNAEAAALCVKLFRGARGLVKALQKGLTPAQLAHINNVLDASFLSPDDVSKFEAVIREAKSLLSTNEQQAENLIAKTLESLPPGSPSYQKFTEMVSASSELQIFPAENDHLPSATSSTPSAPRSPAEFRDKMLQTIAKSKEKDPSRAASLDKFAAAIEHVAKPEKQVELRFIKRFSSAELTRGQKAQILSIFEDNADSDELLNDVVNPHPIAARLWGDRVVALATERVHYTSTFEEGAETFFPDMSTDSRFKNFFYNNNSTLSPTPINPPFNNAIEEINHIKLERLAREIYKFDLDTDMGLAKFDLFSQTFDISPGELTLDRVHGYPPEWHTYEELPIIKFDGYDPLSEEGIAAAEATALQHKDKSQVKVHEKH